MSLFGDHTLVSGRRHRIVKVYDTVQDAVVGMEKDHASALAWPHGEVVWMDSEVLVRDDNKIATALEYDVWRPI